MKKNYIYFGVPIVALVVFAVCYWNFASGYEAQEQAKAAAVQKAKKDKIEAMNRDRQKAFEDATAANEKRKKDKEAKDKADAEKADARDQALDARNKALRDASSLTQKIDRMNKDIEAVKKEIAGIEEQKKQATAEKVFLATYVKQAQDNSAALESVLQKIKEADDAAAAAAKAAAEAAKAAKK
ncbi:MAG TPA: hypothetical protein VG838_17600 [Opitutaceae bacterium]|nr:hypothetical protein [Opitutaceae bacterium]